MTTLVEPLYETDENRRLVTEARLTAMTWYLKLFMDWDLEPIVAPTLLVRASMPTPQMDISSAWRATWPYDPDVIDVPGDHWTMLTEHAGSTAEAIDKWICDAVSEVAS
jgi:hypothetical protein